MINTEEEWGWMDNLPPQQKSQGWFRQPTKKGIRYRQGKTKRQVKDSELILVWSVTMMLLMVIMYGLKLLFDFLTTTAS
jgi:hypothetical protein